MGSRGLSVRSEGSVAAGHRTDGPEHRLARGVVYAVIVGDDKRLARRQDGQAFDLVQDISAGRFQVGQQVTDQFLADNWQIATKRRRVMSASGTR